MADLKQVRKRFIAATGALAAVILLAVAYLLFPVGSSNAELNGDLTQTDKELQMKETQVRPLRGLPEKLIKTNEDILKFYRDRLPARQSDVSEELGKLASREGIALSDVRYADFDTDIPELRAVIVQADLSGEYSKVARFINAVERDKTFLIVDQLSLDDQKAGVVRLQLNFETYLRPPSAGTAPADEVKPKTRVRKGNT